MMYTACAGWFLYTTCLQGALYTNPQSFCMLFAFLLTAGLLWALLVRKSDYSNANADLVRHQLRTANLPVPAGTGSTSCLKICAQSPYWV